MYYTRKEEKDNRAIRADSRKIGSLKELISKKGTHYFKGNLMLGGHSYEIICFENGDNPNRILSLSFTSNKINY